MIPKNETMTETAHNKKILVIEDEYSLRKAILEKLSLSGFTTVGAADGEEGLRVALEWKPDLVLLDLLMPKMDGMEVLKKLRLNFGAELPVIILTNVEPNDQTDNDVVQYKPSYYLVKSNLELENLVNRFLPIFLRVSQNPFPRNLVFICAFAILTNLPA